MNWFDGVVFFVFDLCTRSTVWYFLFFIYELVRRCGIFCFWLMYWFDGVVFFVFDLCTGSTVWYFLFFIYELVRRCGIFCFSFMNWFDGMMSNVHHTHSWNCWSCLFIKNNNVDFQFKSGKTRFAKRLESQIFVLSLDASNWKISVA